MKCASLELELELEMDVFKILDTDITAITRDDKRVRVNENELCVICQYEPLKAKPVCKLECNHYVH